MSPLKYTHHSPSLIANRTHTRASATQCCTDTAPAALSAPHTPRTISGRAVVVLTAPVMPDIRPDLAERALSGTRIQLAAGTPPPLCTRDSSSGRCSRPTTPCGLPLASLSSAGGAVAATETLRKQTQWLPAHLASASRAACSRSCAKHESIMRTDIQRATRHRHSRPASPSPPCPLQCKPEGPGGAQSTGNLRLAAESI